MGQSVLERGRPSVVGLSKRRSLETWDRGRARVFRTETDDVSDTDASKSEGWWVVKTAVRQEGW